MGHQEISGLSELYNVSPMYTIHETSGDPGLGSCGGDSGSNDPRERGKVSTKVHTLMEVERV